MTQAWHRRKSVSLLDAMGFSTGEDDFWQRRSTLPWWAWSWRLANLGAVVYAREILFSLFGDPTQVQQMPWVSLPHLLKHSLHFRRCVWALIISLIRLQLLKLTWSCHGHGISKRYAQLGLTTMRRWKSRRWTNATKLYSIKKWLKYHLLYTLPQ